MIEGIYVLTNILVFVACTLIMNDLHYSTSSLVISCPALTIFLPLWQVGEGMPYLEYALHSELINKMKLRGANAIFDLRVQVPISSLFDIADCIIPSLK